MMEKRISNNTSETGFSDITSDLSGNFLLTNRKMSENDQTAVYLFDEKNSIKSVKFFYESQEFFTEKIDKIRHHGIFFNFNSGNLILCDKGDTTKRVYILTKTIA